MEYNSYDPSKYISDFSWIKNIGDSISKFAYQVPELIEFNKQIKENNRAKDLIYSSLNRYVDKLDPKVVSNIASSMKLDLDPQSQNFDKEARTALKKSIPTFTSSTKNEDYANQAINQFIPLVRAAQSNGGGGSLKYADLMAGFDNEDIVERVNKSSFGQQNLEQERYKQKFEREFGAGGEVETRNKMNTEAAMNQAKQVADFNKEQGRNVADAQSYILGLYDKKDPASIYSNPAFEGASKEAKDAAYEVATKERDSDQKTELTELRNKFQQDLKDQERLGKIYDQTIIETKLLEARKAIADISNKMKGFKKEQKGSEEYTQMDLTVRDAKKSERAYIGALEYLAKYPKATQEQVNTAMSVARSNVDPEDEQQFINDWKSNKYGSGWNPFKLGQEDDLERFKKAYVERFGAEPKVQETKDAKGKTLYKIVPIQGTVRDVTTTTNNMTTTPTGGQSSEITNTLDALKAELERRKQQGK